MIQLLILFMIVSVLVLRFLADQGFGTWLRYVPELTAMVAAAAVVFVGVRSRFAYVKPAYWLVFGAILVGIVCGVLINRVEPGPVFAGLRTYLRALPFFLLPAVVLMKPSQMRTQLVLLLTLCVVQLPVAAYQRLQTQAIGATTGDLTTGTVPESGILSILLICATCVLTAFYLRGHLSKWRYLLLLVVFLAPTTINETKVTLVMLPIALMTTFYVAAAKGRRLRSTLIGLIVLVAFLAVFVPVYDYFMVPRWGYGIMDFLTMEGRVERYLYRGTEIGEAQPAGRVDALVAAVSELSKEPTRLVFGYGIGNASESALGEQFTGAYYYLFATFPVLAFNMLLLEQGAMGVVLVLLLHWMIFRDSIAVARQDNSTAGALAAGWAGVSASIVISMLYFSAIDSTALSFLFWYFSGVIAALRMRHAVDERPQVRPAPAAKTRIDGIPDLAYRSVPGSPSGR